MLLYLAMLVIATLGPMGPMNTFYGATSRIMLAMGRKGQLPEKFAEVDPKSGAPKLACVVLGVITVIGPFLGKNMLIPLTNVSALAFIFSCGMVALACLRMRFTEPDLPRPYEVPGGKFGICVLSRLPQHGGVEHRDRLVGYWPGPHGVHQFPQKVTPSRGGSGARDPPLRAPNPASLG